MGSRQPERARTKLVLLDGLRDSDERKTCIVHGSVDVSGTGAAALKNAQGETSHGDGRRLCAIVYLNSHAFVLRKLLYECGNAHCPYHLDRGEHGHFDVASLPWGGPPINAAVDRSR